MSAAKRPLSWLLLCWVLALSVGWLAWSSLHAVCFRVPPAALGAKERPKRPPSAAPATRVSSVVLVVVDGLRLDVSRELPYLNALRARGVDAVGRAPEPSLSRPGYATMATGALPERSGVRNNAFPWPVELDTIFDRATDAGLVTLGTANLSWWHQNFERGLGSWLSAVGQPPGELEATVGRALDAGANLTLVHLANLDHIGHHEGARHEYRAEARRVDALLSRLLAQKSLERSALVVTSDHGHRERGGHGGPEPEVVNVPLVLCGHGVREGAAHREPVSVGTVGPTIAVLLGLELPRDSTTLPFVQALDPAELGAEYLDARLEDAVAQQAEYSRRLALRAPEQASLAALLPLSSGAELPGSPAGRALGLFSVAAGLALLVRAARRGVALTPLAAMPLVALGPIVALRVADLPWSHSAIVRIELLVSVLAAGTLAGLGAYLVALRLVTKSTEDALFHLRATALGYVALAPLVWLGFGYAHPSRLPGSFVQFAPLVAAFVGGLTSAAFGALEVWIAARDQSVRMRSQAGSSSTSTSARSSRTSA